MSTAVAKGAGRHTRRWRTIRKAFRQQAESEAQPCWLCNQGIDYTIEDTTDDACWEPDHLYPVKQYPERAEDVANLRSSHRRCNNRRGQGDTPLSLGALSRDWFGELVKG